jgi:hypothetical protein
MVGDDDARPGWAAGHLDMDGRASVPGGVLQKIADEAAKQRRVPDDLDRTAAGRRARDRRLERRRLLGRQPDKIDRRAGAGVGRAVIEAARQQDLGDQLVDLGEVADDLFADPGLPPLQPEFDRHAQARERRAQFVTGVGEQRLLRRQQFLDAAGGDVESARDHGDFIVAGFIDARRKRAGPPFLDPRPQAFEPPGQPAGDRIGGERDAARHDQRDRQDAQAGMRRRARPRQHEASVGEVEAHDRRQHGRPDALASRRRDRRAMRGHQRAIGVIDCNVAADLVSEPRDRRADPAGRTVGPGEQRAAQVDAEGAPARVRILADQPPERPHQKGDRDEAGEQRQIDLPEQPAREGDHGSPSCFLAKT